VNGKAMVGMATLRELPVCSRRRSVLSPATVRNHVQNLFVKLGVHSRLQAVAHATRHCLLEP
jgi:hypothetical protein